VRSRRHFLTTALGLLASVGRTQSGPARISLRVGAARRKVTPPLHIPYLSSSGRGTYAPFEGVHDDLWARAVVFDDGRTCIAVLAVDSIGYANEILPNAAGFTATLRRRVASRTGIAPHALMLAATHAHSTPETIGLTDAMSDPAAQRWLTEHLADLESVVVQAWRSRRPAELRFAKTFVRGIARNRRILLKGGTLNRHGPIPPRSRWARDVPVDEELSVVLAEDQTGKPIAVLLNYTAHPVVTMLLPSVSADYCGACCAAVETAFPGATCLFLQGAAGDVNSIYVSTSFEDAVRLGRRLAEGAFDLIRGGMRPVNRPMVRCNAAEVKLKPRSCPSPEDLLKNRDRYPAARFDRLLRLARKIARGLTVAEVQAMAVGQVRWVALPGEPFVETGLRIKQAGASFVVGYANGYLGYLPVRRAYEEGGYEVAEGPWSFVAPGSAEQLEQEARRVLSRCRSPHASPR